MYRLMLVEDDPNMLSMLKTLLQMEGFSILDASQEEAEKLPRRIREAKPDLVLLDVHLGQASGIDVLKRVRQDPQTLSTLVIMTSGMDYCSPCMEAGADGFILKPYMPDELIQLIRKTLGMKETID